MPLAIPAQQEAVRETSTPLLPKNWASYLLMEECWVVRIGKKESKIVVAKRQRKEKAHKNRTKEGPRTRVKTSGEANSSPV